MKMFFLVSLLTILSVLGYTDAYTKCTSRAYDFQGYTFRVDTVTSEKIWTHCKMQNPVFDPERCGRQQSDLTNYVCDPDYLMDSVSQGENIDLSLYNIQTNTSTVCVDEMGQKQSFLVAVLLINRIRVPDFQSPDLCVNDCNELHPILDQTNRTATEAEEDLLIEHFADSIRELWGLGSCNNDVIVFYCQELNKVHISVGSTAKVHLPDSTIDSLTSQLMSYIDNNRLEDGLLFIANELRFALQGTLTPAEILLIMGMALTVLFGLFLSFVLFAGERDVNVWGSEHPTKALEWLVYAVTGVWLIKATMIFTMFVSHKFPFWGAGIGIVLAVCFFIMYILDITILGENTLLTSSI